MATANRETGRDALVSLLTTALVGTGKPAQAIYGYLVGDFAGQSPVVIVASDGTEEDQRTNDSRRENEFYFNAHTFTLFAQRGDTSWTEAHVEDRLDLLEKTIRETLAANRSTATWAFIEIDGRSTVDNVLVAGEEYRHEIIPIRMVVYDN